MSRPDDGVPRGVGPSIDPAEVPVIEGFLLGYLNEDFEVEYGSPEAAMEAFIADSGPEDHALLASEWATVRARLEPLDDEHRLDAFCALGSGWQPGSWSEVDALFTRLARALDEGE
jgi:hypothetical protein